MVPHLRWAGCNNHQCKHYLVYASCLEFREVALLDGLDEETKETLNASHGRYLAAAANFGVSSDNLMRTYKYLHIFLGQAGSSMNAYSYINPHSPLLAAPDTMIKLIELFTNKYKPFRYGTQ